jgi:hypothetical protein
MPSRRALIAGGAGAVLLGGLGYRAWDRGVFTSGEGDAYAPWKEWRGTDMDGPHRPLRAGILAANPHDTQPWLFSISPNGITVFADRSRNLGTFDPFRREMHLGLGAAVENLVHAANAFGLGPRAVAVEGKLTLSPGPEPVRAAQVMLDAAPPERDPLFLAIPLRHTNRGPYRERPIVADDLRLFADQIASDRVRVAFIADPKAKREMGDLIVESTRRIIADPQMSQDSAHWFRTGAREIAKYRDGVTMDTAGLSPWTVKGAKLLPDQDAATADQYWLSMTRDTHVGTAAVFGVILVRDRLSMADSIAAGRAWQRLHLVATFAGISAQPLNQPVECVDRNAMLGRNDTYEKALVQLAAAPGWEPTFVFRMGYAERPALPSPRRPLSDVVKEMA